MRPMGSYRSLLGQRLLRCSYEDNIYKYMVMRPSVLIYGYEAKGYIWL